MVLCAIVGCSNRSARDSVRFFSIPAIVTNQGKKNEEVTRQRRMTWLARIHRADLTDKTVKPYHRVCSDHFISGKPSIIPDDPDWAPTVGSTIRNSTDCTLNAGRSRSLPVASTTKEIRLKKVIYEELLCNKEVQTVESITFKDESSQANLIRHPLCDPALIGEYSQCKDHPLPDIFRAAITCMNKFTDLTFSFHLWLGGLPTYMEVTRVGWYGTPCLGQVPAKVTLSSGGEMHFVVLCTQPVIRNVQEKNGNLNMKYFSEYLSLLSKCSRNMWCSGLSQEKMDKIDLWSRKRDKDCEVYYKAGRNMSNDAIALGIGRCTSCCRKEHYLAASARKLSTCGILNVARCPTRLLSPESANNLLEAYNQTADKLKRKLASLECQLQKLRDQDGTSKSRNVIGAGDLDLDCTTEVHSGKNSCDSDISDWTDKSDPDNTEHLRRCKICERTFNLEISLQSHLREHQLNQLADNGFSCDIGSVQRRLQTHSDALCHQVKIDKLLDIISIWM